MYLDRCQKNTGEAKNGRAWRWELLRNVHRRDGRIQQRESLLPMFLSFGIRIHGRRSW